MLEVELMPDQKQLVLAEGTTAERAYDLYLRGRGYLQRFREAGTIDTAIMMLKDAVAVDSNFAGAYAALGEAYWRKYESDKDTAYVGLAKTSCQRSLDLDEQLTDVHLTLGLIHSGTGFYIEAIREFRQALTLDSTYYEAYRGLHDAYASLNRLQDAEDALKKAILLKRDYWLGHRDLGYFYSRYGRKEEALKQLIKVVELLPENYRSLNDLGGLYYELDSLDKARDFFMRSLALERNYGAASNLGSIYYLEGRYTDASDMYEIALSIDGSDYQVWGNLAMAYYWIPRKRDEAKRAFSTAAAMAEEQRIINPRNPTIIMDLATYYSGMDELTKARPLVFEALTLDPDNRDMMVNVGLFYLQVGTNDSALSYFEMAIERGCPVNQITSLPELQELRNDKMFSRLFNAALRDTSMR
jgi:serine/threonine-protein kinase